MQLCFSLWDFLPAHQRPEKTGPETLSKDSIVSIAKAAFIFGMPVGT